MHEPWYGVFHPADADAPLACFQDADQAKRWRNITYGKQAAIREVIVAALEPGKQATGIAERIDLESVKDADRLLTPLPATAKGEPEPSRAVRADVVFSPPEPEPKPKEIRRGRR